MALRDHGNSGTAAAVAVTLAAIVVLAVVLSLLIPETGMAIAGFDPASRAVDGHSSLVGAQPRYPVESGSVVYCPLALYDTLLDPLEIVGFVASPDTIKPGEEATLSWRIEGKADRVTLEPGFGEIVGTSSLVVYPSQTTTYTLTATNDDTITSAQVTVVVVEPPQIASFSADPASIVFGETTTLSWSIPQPVDTLTLVPVVGDVSGQTSVVVSPTQSVTYILTAENLSGIDTAEVSVDVDISMFPTELLVYHWNREVTTAQSGFPRKAIPPEANGDWTGPRDFSRGTLHFYVEIHSQPVAKDMMLQFCFWQNQYTGEECASKTALTGNPGTIRTWQKRVDRMSTPHGSLPIDWSVPRQTCGVSIRNSEGLPVSDAKGMDWSGENPDEWYPLDMRFITVVVAEGEKFSGWENYTD